MQSNARASFWPGARARRLHPATQAISKQLLPVYDKPMIYYPLTALMLAGIRDILIITTPQDMPRFQRLLGDGSQWGINLSYAVQPSPDGLAQAFIIGENSSTAISQRAGAGRQHLLRPRFAELLHKRRGSASTAPRCLPTTCKDPERYGVVEFDAPTARRSAWKRNRSSRESNYAVTGLYFYDEQVVRHRRSAEARRRAASWRSPTSTACTSPRQLDVEIMGRGYAWLDTGTHDSPARSQPVHRDDRAPAGPEGGLPGRDRLPAAAGSTRRNSSVWPSRC